MDQPPSEALEYAALETTEPSLRLLRFAFDHPDDEELHLCMENFMFSRCPPYKALSYTWSNPFPPDQVQNTVGERYPPDEEYWTRSALWSVDRHQIRCNGRAVKIALNLYEALSCLAKRGTEDYLWVDRLCINQDDAAERSSQVSLMAEIYTRASTVIVWFGRSGSDAVAVMTVQTSVADPVFDVHQKGGLDEAAMNKHDPADDQYLATFGIAPLHMHVWFAWTQFFRRTWFYRRWTLQETSLARHIEALCGELVLDWYKLKFMVSYLRNSQWRAYLKRFMRTLHLPDRALLSREFVESVHLDPEGWKQECAACYGVFSQGAVLTEMLWRSCQLRCGEPRDVIFALLGTMSSLPRPNDAEDIPVQYDAGLPELLMAVIQRCVLTVPDLAVLSLVQDIGRRSNNALPSWIPDFHAIAERVVGGHLALNRRRPAILAYDAAFSAMNAGEMPYRSVQDGVLRLKGACVGAVQACSLDGTFATPETTAGFFVSLLDMCVGAPQTVRGKQTRVEGFWRTLVADSEEVSHPAPPELGACFHDWVLKYLFMIRASSKAWPEALTDICIKLTELSSSCQGTSLLPNVTNNGEWLARLHDLRDGAAHDLLKYISASSYSRFDNALAIYNKVVFRTAEGDLGVGPVSTRAGDRVWVFEGTRVPFLVRPVQEGFCQLLGECYLHGIMYGELIQAGKLDFEGLALV